MKESKPHIAKFIKLVTCVRATNMGVSHTHHTVLVQDYNEHRIFWDVLLSFSAVFIVVVKCGML